MEVKILESILQNKEGKLIEVVTDRKTVTGILRFIDIHGNLVLENGDGHTVFIQRSWIQVLTVLEA